MSDFEAHLQEWRGLPAIGLRLPGGDSALIALQGAQVLSWVSRGQERLFVSPRAAHDEIRFPGEVVGGKAEFVERACIDEMNGDAEADAEADCCERQKRPPGLRAQGTRYEGTEERRCERQPGH